MNVGILSPFVKSISSRFTLLKGAITSGHTSVILTSCANHCNKFTICSHKIISTAVISTGCFDVVEKRPFRMPISSSLFDTFSLHATVTKHGSASLEIDIPVAELRGSFSPLSNCELCFLEETRRLLRALFVIFFALILVSLLLAMVEGATDGLGNWVVQLLVLIPVLHKGTLLGFGIPTLVLALFYPIIIVSWKNRFFRHEIVEITPNGVWMTVKTVTYTAFLKEFLWTPQSDIESNKEQEVIIKNRSLERGEFFRARVRSWLLIDTTCIL